MKNGHVVSSVFQSIKAPNKKRKQKETRGANQFIRHAFGPWSCSACSNPTEGNAAARVRPGFNLARLWAMSRDSSLSTPYIISPCVQTVCVSVRVCVCMRVLSTGDVVYYIYKYINMNIVICGVTNSPASLPVRGPCEEVPPFSAPSAHARLVDTAATTVAYRCFFLSLPEMSSRRWHLCNSVYRSPCHQKSGLLLILTFSRKVTIFQICGNFWWQFHKQCARLKMRWREATKAAKFWRRYSIKGNWAPVIFLLMPQSLCPLMGNGVKECAF